MRDLGVLERTKKEDFNFEDNSETDDLAKAVAEQLKYTALLERQNQLKLMEALYDLEALPFTPESIERYKVQVKKKNSQKLVYTGIILGAILFCLSFGPVFLGLPLHWFSAGWVAVIFVASFVCGSFLCFYSVCRRNRNKILWGLWQTTSLSEYKEPVPEFALRYAIEIKKKIPQVEFSVNHFVKSDPFLVVHYEGKDYYIAVWGEPDFKAEIMA